MTMEQQQEQCQEMSGESCLPLAVLQERVDGLMRANAERDTRLASVEKKIGELTEKVDGIWVGLEKRFAVSEDAAWKRFWLLAAFIVAAAVGMAFAKG